MPEQEEIMTPTENLALLHRVFSVLEELDDYDSVMFNAGNLGLVHPYVIVNDVFGWACCDAESILLSNIDVYEQAAKDVLAIVPRHPPKDTTVTEMEFPSAWDVGVIFACRVRNARPFKHHDKYPVNVKLYPLIEAIEEVSRGKT